MTVTHEEPPPEVADDLIPAAPWSRDSRAFPHCYGVPPVAERRPSVTGGNTLHRLCGVGAGVADRLCPCRPSVEAVPARLRDAQAGPSRRGLHGARAALDSRPGRTCGRATCSGTDTLRRNWIERLSAVRPGVVARRARCHRPEPGDTPKPTTRLSVDRAAGRRGFLPASRSTATTASKTFAASPTTREELEQWVEANAAAAGALSPRIVSTNHVPLGGPVGAASGAVRRQGARLGAGVRDAGAA